MFYIDVCDPFSLTILCLLSAKSVSRFLHFPCGYPLFYHNVVKKTYFLHCFTFVPLLHIIWVNLICTILTCYFFLSSLLIYSFISIIVSEPLKLYSNTLKWVNFRLSFNIMLVIFFRYSIFQYWWNIRVLLKVAFNVGIIMGYWTFGNTELFNILKIFCRYFYLFYLVMTMQWWTLFQIPLINF